MKRIYLLSGVAVCMGLCFFIMMWVTEEEQASMSVNKGQVTTLANELLVKPSSVLSANGQTEQPSTPGLTDRQAVPPLNAHKKAYDEDWCLLYELTEEGVMQYQQERADWDLQQGRMHFNDELSIESYHGEFLEPYKEEDIQTLWELGEKGDRLALIALVNRQGMDHNLRDAAAVKLAILGDMVSGLRVLMLKYLFRAKDQYAQTEVASEQIKADLLSALAMVQIGLERKDTSALETYLSMVESYQESLAGLNPDSTLTDADLKQIKPVASAYKQWLDEQRLEQGLPPLSDIEIPRVAGVEYDRRLGFVMAEYGDYIRGSSVLALWNQSYLKTSPCVEKQASLFSRQ